MLIVSPEMCQNYAMINLHPAAPGGPKGTWQEVIWHLIADNATETGVMMHRVTKALDEGAPITYCTFPIRGKSFDLLWQELGVRLNLQSLPELIVQEGESNALFQRIRQEEVKREIPLIVLTLKALAEQRIRISGDQAYCLNEEIETYLKHHDTYG